MSTPKIKVYRLEKGYNKDSDNDIQSKINSELLPFIEKPTKPTDAYYLTGISEQLVQWNGEKINTSSFQLKDGIFTDDGIESDEIDCTNWIKNGFYRPRLGYEIETTNENNEIIKKFEELSNGFNNSELEILGEIEKVRGGQESEKTYFTVGDFLFSHPLIYQSTDEKCYEIVYLSENKVKFVLNEEKITELGLDKKSSDYIVQYYEVVTDESNTNEIKLNDYPIYNGSNYYYIPELFNSGIVELEFEEEKDESGFVTKEKNYSEVVSCGNDWLFFGNGKPVVTYDNVVLTEGKDYELIYSFSEKERKLVVKISDECLTKNNEQLYKLHYNTDDCLITEGYNLNEDTGLLTFESDIPENLFIYYRKKVQKSKTFVSEHVNWSFGHLRENPDIFFGEKDYPGDEAEDADTGTPIYAGMKPTFISNGYQIDYFRGTVNFTDGLKSVYRSEAEVLEKRDIYTPETFVRANFSYYPEVFNVFRQKMECVSETDGYTYKPQHDKRFANSINKRWIVKSDNYQPIFFENWTEKINVCSQYLTTAPNYDELENKRVEKILGTDNGDTINSKLTFILPVIESKNIVFSDFETTLNSTISFKNDNDEIVETFTLSSQKNAEELEIFYLNDDELKQGEINEFGDKVKMKFIMLCSENNTISFQIISAEVK